MAPQALADQVLLVGFDGTDATAPFLDEVRTHQFGGIFVDSRNWTDADHGHRRWSARCGRPGARARGSRRCLPPTRRAVSSGRSPTCRPSRTSWRSATPATPKAAEDWAQRRGSGAAHGRIRPRPVPGRRRRDPRQPAGRPRLLRRHRTLVTRAHRRVDPRLPRRRPRLRGPSLPGPRAPPRRTPTAARRRSSLDEASLASRDLAAVRGRLRRGDARRSCSRSASTPPTTRSPPGRCRACRAPACCATSSATTASRSPTTSAPARCARATPRAKAAVAALAAGADLLQIDSTRRHRPGVDSAILDAVSERRAHHRASSSRPPAGCCS